MGANAAPSQALKGLSGSAITGGTPVLSQAIKGFTGSGAMGGTNSALKAVKGLSSSGITGGTNSALAQAVKGFTRSVTAGGMNSALAQAFKGFTASTSMGGMNPVLAQAMNGLTSASALRGMRSFEAALLATRGTSVDEAAMKASQGMGPLEAVLKATRGTSVAEAAMRASRGMGSFEATLGIIQAKDRNSALSSALELGRVSLPPAPKPTAVPLVQDLAVNHRRLEDELERKDRKTEELEFRILALEEERDEQRILLADQHQVLCHLVYARICDLADWTDHPVEQIVDSVLADIPDGVLRQDLLELRDYLIQLVDGP